MQRFDRWLRPLVLFSSSSKNISHSVRCFAHPTVVFVSVALGADSQLLSVSLHDTAGQSCCTKASCFLLQMVSFPALTETDSIDPFQHLDSWLHSYQLHLRHYVPQLHKHHF